MTAAEQHSYWLKFHKFQLRYERMYAPKINKALKDQVRQYITTRDTVYVRSGGLYAVLIDLYRTTGSAWAHHTRKPFQDKAGGQMGFSDRIVAFMQQYFGINLLNDAEGITQTTIRLISEVLSESALQGWSFDEIVDKLTSDDFTATRARLIARTETVNAANAGSMVNLKVAGATKKIWISARDSRVRMHHAEVNQTVIPIDDKFMVGGFAMDHPGDKAGGASEVCNCRCVVAGIVEEKNNTFVIDQKMQNFSNQLEEMKTNISVSFEKQAGDVEKFVQAIGTIEIKQPDIIVEQPEIIVNPTPVTVPAAIVNVVEQKVDTTSITEMGIGIMQGQERIISLLEESLKPEPKKKWKFTNNIQDGRIVSSIAEQIN